MSRSKIYDIPEFGAFRLKLITRVTIVTSRTASHAGDYTHEFYLIMKGSSYAIRGRNVQVTEEIRRKLLEALNQ